MRTLLTALLVLVVAPACGSAPSTPDAGDSCASPTRSPPTLVANSGFECGGEKPAEWSAIYGTLSMATEGHSGARAGQVTADGLGGRFSYTGPVATNSGAQRTWCGAAWMKGTTPNAKLTLMADSSGGGTAYSFTSPINGTWIRLPLSTNLQAPVPSGSRLLLLFEMKDQKAGDTLLVDDVDVWESPDGKCQEVR